MPSPKAGSSSSAQRVVDLVLKSVHAGGRHDGAIGVVVTRHRGAEDRHHRVADELHDRSPFPNNGAIHRGAVGVELAGQLTGVGVLGDRGVRADVAHDDGHVEPFGFADAAALVAKFLGDSAGQQSRKRLALLLAVHDGAMEVAQAIERALVARAHFGGELAKEVLDLGVDGLGRRAPRRGDGLDRFALGDEGEERLFDVGELAVRSDRAHQRLDDGGVEGGAAGRDHADGFDELVALGEVVLQEIAVAGRTLGEQRHGVLGVVVLREDHDAGTGVALAHLFGRVDPLAVERRRHADVGDEHVGSRRRGPGHGLVVVRADADDLQVSSVGR